jgi:plasmid stability protein
MTTFTLKGIPDDLYERLKRRAAENRRSINGEMLICLEEALLGGRVNQVEMLAKVDAVRERLNMRPYTQAALNAAKRRGRK